MLEFLCHLLQFLRHKYLWFLTVADIFFEISMVIHPRFAAGISILSINSFRNISISLSAAISVTDHYCNELAVVENARYAIKISIISIILPQTSIFLVRMVLLHFWLSVIIAEITGCKLTIVNSWEMSVGLFTPCTTGTRKSEKCYEY